MFSRFPRQLLFAALLTAVAGCTSFGVREQTDREVCDLSARPIDLEASPPAQLPPPRPTGEETSTQPTAPAQLIEPVAAEAPDQATALLVETQQKTEKKDGAKQRRVLELPRDLPGADAPPIQMPPITASKEEKEAALRKLFPPLPLLGKELVLGLGPTGNPLTLSDLQRLARANNPDLVRAVANVRAAEGVAIQAGLHPNPNFGYVADTISTANTAGYQGVFFEQMIKTAGKLELARQSASVDVANARLALRATENDVATRVRSAYFAVLVAQENVRVSRALAQFTEDVYNAGLELLRSGFAVTYEPMQFRSQVFQARNSLVTARNSHNTAWRQLASALGLPGMPPTQVAGRVDAALPVFPYEQVRDAILSRHTDVLTAQNDILRARINLRLARITPIPDVDLQLKFQRDYPGFTSNTTTSIQLTVPVPVFDRNQGNIVQAEAQLRSAEEEPHKARDDLYARLADAFGRYETSRVQIEYFRQHVLPDQVRSYKALYERYHTESAKPGLVVTSAPPTFQDLVNAQQNLVTTIQTYLTALGSRWTSVVDVANLLQTEDIFQIGDHQEVHPIPELCTLPCCHPCSPLPEPSL
ncbi:MAG TPA: TolC family protein, partial [Gemmataceae bacterium]|nr:TolC family protein [Gemmataceae bacterium]